MSSRCLTCPHFTRWPGPYDDFCAMYDIPLYTEKPRTSRGPNAVIPFNRCNATIGPHLRGEVTGYTAVELLKSLPHEAVLRLRRHGNPAQYYGSPNTILVVPSAAGVTVLARSILFNKYVGLLDDIANNGVWVKVVGRLSEKGRPGSSVGPNPNEPEAQKESPAAPTTDEPPSTVACLTLDLED